MIQGTTPRHVFKTPFNTALIDRLRITYSQGGTTKLQKSKPDCTITDGIIETKLTQEETLEFDHSVALELQLHVVTKDGEHLKTKVKKIPVERALDKEVL